MKDLIRTNSPARRSYSKEERHERACLRVAAIIHGLWEEGKGIHTRLFDSPLLLDEFTNAGESVDYGGAGCREHVVPLKFLRDECCEMLECDRSVEELAKFIIEHVKIVRISKEEQISLDRRKSLGGLGLRDKMPDGWQVGDDIYARITLAGIKLKLA